MILWGEYYWFLMNKKNQFLCKNRLFYLKNQFLTAGSLDWPSPTEWIEWMAHRKQKETKQQPSTAGPGNILGCCLVSLRFLCNIHSIHPVVLCQELLYSLINPITNPFQFSSHHLIAKMPIQRKGMRALQIWCQRVTSGYACVDVTGRQFNMKKFGFSFSFINHLKFWLQIPYINKKFKNGKFWHVTESKLNLTPSVLAWDSLQCAEWPSENGEKLSSSHAQLGCCLVSLHFLWAILWPPPAHS